MPPIQIHGSTIISGFLFLKQVFSGLKRSQWCINKVEEARKEKKLTPLPLFRWRLCGTSMCSKKGNIIYTTKQKDTWSRYYYAWCISPHRFTFARILTLYTIPNVVSLLALLLRLLCQSLDCLEWTHNERSTYQHRQQWTNIFHWLLSLRSSGSNRRNRLRRRASRRERRQRRQRRQRTTIANRRLSSRKRARHLWRYRSSSSRRRIRRKGRSCVWRFWSVGVRCRYRVVRWVRCTLRRIGGSTGGHDRRWTIVWRCRRSCGRSCCNRRDIHIADFVQKLYMAVSLLW